MVSVLHSHMQQRRLATAVVMMMQLLFIFEAFECGKEMERNQFSSVSGRPEQQQKSNAANAGYSLLNAHNATGWTTTVASASIGQFAICPYSTLSSRECINSQYMI